MTIDLDQLKQIFQLVREHELSELEVEQDGLRLRVCRGGSPAAAAIPLPMAAAPVHAASAPTAASAAVPTMGAAGDSEIELAVVKSPIVGTFYGAPEPGAAAFVEIGATVKKGQVLCIIEAMKLMNEIDSEYDGEVVNVYVENGQAVQYGERLFAIRTK